MRRTRFVMALVLATVLALISATAGHAGFMDAVKQKVKEKTTQKAVETTDKAMDDAEKKATGKGGKAAPGSPEASGAAKEPESGGAKGGGAFSSVSTKFDFVPGDSVLFLDDFTQDDLGEFPSRWTLGSGTFEVAEMDKQRWLRCTSSDGDIRMKASGIPDLWTLEFDSYCVNVGGAIALTVTAQSNSGDQVWIARFPYSGSQFNLACGSIISNTIVEGTPIEGRHHVMFLGRGTAVKAYLDRERVGNIPDVSAQGTATQFDIRLGAPGKPMIANVRFAQGPRPPKDLLAEGKLVTHGILFDTGSDVVLPESAPVLRQIAGYMESNAGVKLKVTGHTDNVGAKDGNLDLSKRRAASVAKVLSTQFGVSADRFTTDGKGDTQPVSNNAKPEGRAMNRRVEFAKL
jgi:OmpA-OmpF porin, OOP family